MEWHEQIVSWMSTFLLLSGFLTVFFHRFKNILNCYMAQSFALSCAIAAIAHHHGELHLLFLSVATLVLKAGIIPAWMRSFMKKVAARGEEKMFLGVSASLFCAAGILLLSHMIAGTVMGPGSGVGSGKADDLTICLTLLLLGLFLMMTRKQALTQMLGILFMENAITAAAILLAGGMPMIIDLGIILDVLIGILVMGTLVFRIQNVFDTTDTDELRTLHG
jgi:hydrogenase-4 component E